QLQGTTVGTEAALVGAATNYTERELYGGYEGQNMSAVWANIMLGRWTLKPFYKYVDKETGQWHRMRVHPWGTVKYDYDVEPPIVNMTTDTWTAQRLEEKVYPNGTRDHVLLGYLFPRWLR